MPDFSLALPTEVCAELGRRARARRVALNVSVEDLAARIGISDRTLRNFEQSGRCTLETFARILEALDALADLEPVLLTQSRTIEDMRQQARARQRKRAYRKQAPPPETGSA
ncbi:MAG: helix-turn-helix domain-containing protein [Burkholderiaceae bacterium]